MRDLEDCVSRADAHKRSGAPKTEALKQEEARLIERLSALKVTGHEPVPDRLALAVGGGTPGAHGAGGGTHGAGGGGGDSEGESKWKRQKPSNA